MCSPDYVTDHRQHRAADVADHEVYLSFASDEDALAFRDWLYDAGWQQFKAYRSEVQR